MGLGGLGFIWGLGFRGGGFRACLECIWGLRFRVFRVWTSGYILGSYTFGV